MWWLAVPVVAGAAAAVWALLDDDAKDARQRWERDRASVQRSVEEHRENIERNLTAAESSYSFAFLTDLHFSSFRVADHAYAALKDARKSLDTMGKMLVDAKKRRTELRQQQKGAPATKRKELQEEIEMLNELRAAIFPDKDQVKAQRNELQDEVRRLNQQTHELKIAIRDRCGPRGRRWYAELEERKARRRRRGR